jgi:hypothetical protein
MERGKERKEMLQMAVMERFNDAFPSRSKLPSPQSQCLLLHSLSAVAFNMRKGCAASKLHQILTFSFPKYTTRP